MALVDNAPRAATCVAECAASESVTCVSMRRARFEQLFGNLREKIDLQLKRRILRSLVIFEAVPEPAVDRAADCMQRNIYVAGDVIVREGAEGDKLFIIREGRVRVTKAMYDDQGRKTQQQIGVLEDHACFGERALVDAAPRNATVVAQSPEVSCYELTRDAFEECVAELDDEYSDDGGAVDISESIALEPGDLRVAARLGRGAFGQVLLCARAGGSPVALKVTSKQVVAGKTRTLLAERSAVEKFESHFVVKFLNAFQDRDFLYLALEYCPGGDLYGVLHGGSGVDKKAARFFVACVALGLEHVHSKNVAWRDLKPENVLLDAQGYAKLSDFGFARDFSEGEARTFTLCGTPDYLAPEVVLSQGHDRSVDLWALGVLGFE